MVAFKEMYLYLHKALVESQNYFCPYSTILSFIFLNWILILEASRCWTNYTSQVLLQCIKSGFEKWELAIWYSKTFTLILFFCGRRVPIISLPRLLHEKKETQDRIKGEQWDDSIFLIICYSWVNAIKKALVHSLEFGNGFISTILSSSGICFLGTFVQLN